MSTTSKTEHEYQSEWLQKVHDHEPALRQLVASYHPSARQYRRAHNVAITAPNAEQACENVRQLIQKEHPEDPVTRWDRAVADGDVGTIMSLLDGAWFGVPESTSCWQIPGFDVAVDLLDDPPRGPEEGDDAS